MEEEWEETHVSWYTQKRFLRGARRNNEYVQCTRRGILQPTKACHNCLPQHDPHPNPQAPRHTMVPAQCLHMEASQGRFLCRLGELQDAHHRI
jgi:hypothetical protein